MNTLIKITNTLVGLMMLVGLTHISYKTLTDPKAFQVCYDIVAINSELDNRVSGTDFFFGNGSITKTQTVYYVLLENGRTRDISRDDYHRYKVGDEYCE